MTTDAKDIIEIKPGAYGVHLDLRALWRQYFSKKKQDDPVTIVARRFLKVFAEHGVAVSQIPRLIPEVTLSHLRNVDTLLPALTPSVLHATAKLFGIRQKWLEGDTAIIYDCHWSYKNPWAFFEDLKTLDIDAFDFPVVGFTSVKNLDFKSGRDQHILLVLREKCAQLDDKDVHRYRIHDQFLWGYWKSRIQLKAMMRVWYKQHQSPVRLYRVSSEVMKEMEAGRLMPGPYYTRGKWIQSIELEDFSLMPSESTQAKELEELPMVMEYIDAFKLDHIGHKGVVNPHRSPEALRFTQ